MNTPQDPKAIRAAIKNFRRLLELEPRHRGHREQLARLFEADGQPKAAVREWLGLARDLRNDGFPEEAVTAAREALRVEPGHEEAMSLLASVYAGAPRNMLMSTVTEAVPVDPLDEMGRPESDAPLDAVALVKVYSTEEAGVEMASQASESEFDLSVSVDESVGSAGDMDDRRVTVDLMPETVPDASTVELSEEDLGGLFVDLTPAEAGLSVDLTPAEASPLMTPLGRPVAVAIDEGLELAEAHELELFTAGSDDSHPDDGSHPSGPISTPADVPSQRQARAPLPSPADRPRLANIPLFSSLPRAPVQDLMQRADRRFFAAGSELMCSGDTVDGLYVILSGAARLTVRSHDGRMAVEIAVVETGGFFGEADLMEGRPSQLNARAIEDVEALKLGADRVAFLRRHFPAFERTLDEAAELHTVSRCLAASALFGAIPAKDRAVLAARFRPIALGPGEELFAEGSAPEGLYLVTRGSLIIYREGATLTQMPAGEFVGVVSMLRQEAAQCTALAGPSAQVVCLDPEEVEAVLGQWQSVREAFWREARVRTQSA